jgi:hypothetical protein
VSAGDKKGKVVHLETAFAERAAKNDKVVQLALRILTLIEAEGCSEAEALAALGLSGKALRDMMLAYKAKEEVEDITDHAMRLSAMYRINLKPKDEG